ncbi:MAG TPA: type II toxin-antitoxin system VapC family toxin [Nocardioides sp.]
MIADTSSLVCIVLGEPDAESHAQAILGATRVAISSATLVEASIVLEARQGPDATRDLELLIERCGVEVVPLDATQAREAMEVWRRFGKGRHPAALNFGDCFAYALARSTDEPLLFKGDDFSQTDIRAALA